MAQPTCWDLAVRSSTAVCPAESAPHVIVMATPVKKAKAAAKPVIIRCACVSTSSCVDSLSLLRARARASMATTLKKTKRISPVSHKGISSRDVGTSLTLTRGRRESAAKS